MLGSGVQQSLHWKALQAVWGLVTGVSLSRPEAQMPLVGGADQERDARVVPQPLRLQRVVTGRDRGWGNQSAILSESGLWQEAPSPRAFLTQPAD